MKNEGIKVARPGKEGLKKGRLLAGEKGTRVSAKLVVALY